MKSQKKSAATNTTGNGFPTFSDELVVHNTNKVRVNSDDEECIQHFALIAECSEDAILSKNFDGTITSWNKGCEKIFGYTTAEMTGKNIALIIPSILIEQEKSILNRVSQNQSIKPYETTVTKKNAEPLHVSLTVSPLKNRTGNIIGAFTIGRDITPRKKLEESLIKANKELALQIDEKEWRAVELLTANKKLAFQNEEKQKRAAELLIANKELAFQNVEKEKRAAELIAINQQFQKSQTRLKEVNKELEAFTYSVSHDLRAPLRAVNSYAQILQEDYEQTIGTDGMQILESICYNSKKMGVLIDELLSFSRLGRKDIDRVDIDMNEFIQSIIDDFKKTNDHHATINVGPMPMVKADYTLLRQVLVNLVSNAIKYSAKKPKPVVDIFVEYQNENPVFVIKDNGAGFDMRFADKLFGVFQRLHSEKEFEGNGVGLAIVHRIISKHGGRVWAQGKENEGASFYFTIN